MTFLDISFYLSYIKVAVFVYIVLVIAHIYLTTTGHSLKSNIKAMITGWVEIEEETKLSLCS